MPSKLLKKLSKPKICVMDICIPLLIVVIALMYVYRAEVMNFLPSHKRNEAFFGSSKPEPEPKSSVWDNMRKAVGIQEDFGKKKVPVSVPVKKKV